MTIEQIQAVESGTSSAKTKNTSKTGDFSSVLQETTSLDSIINKASEKYNVPAALIKAVCKAESNFTSTAVSKCGAKGIMQLMPSTAKAMGVKDAFDPEQNIMGGTKLLSTLLDKYNGNVSYALAAYNAGTGNVDKYGGIPPFKETQNYVKKIAGYLSKEISTPDISYSQNTSEALTTTDLTKADVDADIQKIVEQINSSLSFEYNDYLDFINIFMKYMGTDTTTSSSGSYLSSSMPYALQQMLS